MPALPTKSESSYPSLRLQMEFTVVSSRTVSRELATETFAVDADRRDATHPSTTPRNKMSALSLKIYCLCLNLNSLPPPSKLPSFSPSYHKIHDVYFCEEYDSIRCCRCASIKVGGYYCLNFLFKVPSASIRGEKNRHVVVNISADSSLTWFCKEHFVPFIRASSASSSASHHLRTTQHTHSNPITAAASDPIPRGVPGVSKYNPPSRSRVGRGKPKRDEMPDGRFLDRER
jgi:hypothetical protein